jgi:hypothetical protein
LAVARRAGFGADLIAANGEQRGSDGLSYLVSFVRNFDAFQTEWRAILDPHTFAELAAFQHSLRAGDTDQRLPDASWVRLVFEVAAAWKRRVLPRGQVLGLFVPLFLARAGSFLLESQWKEAAEIESQIKRMHSLFHTLQPVLRRLWTGAPRPSANSRALLPRREAA